MEAAPPPDLEKTRAAVRPPPPSPPPSPPARLRAYWRRYIYLWINYALFEELEAKDKPERAREVYRECRSSSDTVVFLLQNLDPRR